MTAATRALALGVALAIASLAASSSASGQSAATLIIDDRTPTLTETDDGWTTSLVFTNLTAAEAITVEPPASADGCEIKLKDAEIPAAERATVIVEIPTGCDAGDGINFDLSASAASPASFTVSASPKKTTDDPDWSALWAFPIAFVASLVAALVFFLIWKNDKRALHTPLKSLEATWSFKDSWVSNVTVAAGLLTGIFGSSEVVTALLGEDADASVALATVGAAFAVAFISAGPIIVLATKTKEGDYFTIGGVLLASAVTLAGAFGELYVLYESGRQLDLGGWEDYIFVLALMAGILLAVYAYRALVGTLGQGLKRPKKKPPSDAILAAEMIVQALKAQPGTNVTELEAAIDDVKTRYPGLETSSGDDDFEMFSERSALL